MDRNVQETEDHSACMVLEFHCILFCVRQTKNKTVFQTERGQHEKTVNTKVNDKRANFFAQQMYIRFYQSLLFYMKSNHWIFSVGHGDRGVSAGDSHRVAAATAAVAARRHRIVACDHIAVLAIR